MSAMRFVAWMLLAILAAVAVAVWYWPRPVAHVAGGLRQEVYIWQRAWTEDVKASVEKHGTAFDRVVVLGAQISWEKPAEPRVFHVPVDWSRLGPSAKEVGVAIRIGSYTGPFEGASAQLVAALAGKLCDQARRAGLKLAEIQLDFDAAESKLEGYRTWVHAAKGATGGVPVHITALPTWLKSRGFAALAAEAGGYVLQVHSLDRPLHLSDPAALCDPRAANDAVERASRLGIPFCVALPTYGYVIIFDKDGKYAGLEAEGPAHAWPAGSQKRWLGSQAGELAGLCRDWEKHRPPALRGIIWYRLPVEADRNNWRWTTLEAVMQGRSPQAKIAVDIGNKDGVCEISIRNQGQADYRGPLQIATHWDHAHLQASDGLDGFEEVRGPPGQWRLKGLLDAGQRLAPGECRQVGWIRLDHETEVSANVEEISQ